MNNRIYQSPDVYTVLSNRLVRFSTCFRCRLVLNAHRLAYISVIIAIVIGPFTNSPARLYTSNGFRLADYGPVNAG